MAEIERLTKKLHSALKLSGFNIKREFCSLIIHKFFEESVDLTDAEKFNSCVRNLCTSLENQCLVEQSIKKDHINRALEVCLHSGYDRNETVFSVLNAFEFPKMSYDADRKQFFLDQQKSGYLSAPESKSKLFLDRYQTILQRTKRNFKNKKIGEDCMIQLQTVDFLLTQTSIRLDKILILGSLLLVSDGKYCLEDPTGSVMLDLAHARFYGGFFVETSFVLVNGYYEDKMLKVATLVLPPGEEYGESRHFFGSLNYFGGQSKVALKDSVRLREHLTQNPDDAIMFFSNVWLDNPLIFDKLETLFEGLSRHPPIAFVFMGNFMSESCNTDKLQILRKLFKQLAELIAKFPDLVSQSNFVFVPGLEDPCVSHIVPRPALPGYITEEMSKMLNKAVFTSNPCRIQYCTKEITVFRADVLPKLLQAALHKPPKKEIADDVTRTILSQGHLSPMSLNALPVHWDFDYTLRLYPLPDLVVIGDKAEAYTGKYKGCQIFNPGSFCESGFQFKCYVPGRPTDNNENIQDCEL